jgi:hypothetical protein
MINGSPEPKPWWRVGASSKSAPEVVDLFE